MYRIVGKTESGQIVQGTVSTDGTPFDALVDGRKAAEAAAGEPLVEIKAVRMEGKSAFSLRAARKSATSTESATSSAPRKRSRK